MKRLLLLITSLLIAIPLQAQDTPVEAIPVCNDAQLAQLPAILLDSGFLLDYALISFGPITDDGSIDYLPSITQTLAVRDVWIEAIVPNLPDCVQSIDLHLMMGDYLDQSLIQMMTGTLNDQVDTSFADRADIEMARLQGFDIELGVMFETLFADVDIESALREQMEAQESGE